MRELINDTGYEIIKEWSIDDSVEINKHFEFEIEDSTAQAGILYRYKIIFLYESGGKKYKSICSKASPVLLFDDIYLIDSKGAATIRYNPEISGVKYNIGESLTTTLGGRYPIYRKNGQ